MRHAYMYAGPFAANHSGLRPGRTTYTATDGAERELYWPAEADGLRVAYMEKRARKFYAVRVQYEDHDIVLDCPVHIDPARHLNNRRLGADPSLATDDEASALLDDIIRDNPAQQPALAMMINRINQVRRAGRSSAATEAH